MNSAEAVSNVEQTLDQLLNNSKFLLQYVKSILLNVTPEQIHSRELYQDNAYQQKKIEIVSKMNDWLQSSMATKQLLQVMINVIANLLGKFVDENRLSDSFDDVDSISMMQKVFTRRIEDQLIQKFDFVMNHLANLRPIVIEFNRVLNKLYQKRIVSNDDYTKMNKCWQEVSEFIETSLPQLMTSSVAISKQTPLVILKDTHVRNPVSTRTTNTKEHQKCHSSFDMELKIYMSNILHSLSIVSATLITEEDAIKAKKDANFSPKSVRNSELLNSTQHFKAMQGNNGTILTASFSDMRIRLNRIKAKNVESMHYVILFQFRSEKPIKIGTDLEINLNMTLTSLPFCILVNHNQVKNVLPTIFWTRSFNKLEIFNSTLHMNLAEKIPWPIFTYWLNKLFVMTTGGIKMSDDQLNHVAQRLFGLHYNDKRPLNYEDFFKIWPWLYSYLEIIGSEKFRPYWNNSLVIGFVSRKTADYLLRRWNEASLLIKFSDCMEGQLVFSFYLPELMSEVIHTTVEEFDGRKMSVLECLEKLCEEYQCLKKVEYVIYGYKPDERKHISEIAKVNINELIKRDTTLMEQSSVMEKPYFKVLWRMCLQNRDLHNCLQRETTTQEMNGTLDEISSLAPNLASPSTSTELSHEMMMMINQGFAPDNSLNLSNVMQQSGYEYQHCCGETYSQTNQVFINNQTSEDDSIYRYELSQSTLMEDIEGFLDSLKVKQM